MRRRILIVLLAVLPLAGAAGCRQQPRRRDFTAVLAGNNRKLAKAGYDFRQTVAPLQKGQQADTAQVQAAYDEIVTTLKEVRRDVDNLDPPSPSQSAPALLQAYKDFLAAQETYPDQYYQKIVQIASNGQLTPAQKWPQIFAQFQQMYQNDSNDYTALKNAEKAYCDEHHYSPTNLEMLYKDK